LALLRILLVRGGPQHALAQENAFAKVHADTPEDAIKKACGMTDGHDPANCESVGIRISKRSIEIRTRAKESGREEAGSRGCSKASDCPSEWRLEGGRWRVHSRATESTPRPSLRLLSPYPRRRWAATKSGFLARYPTPYPFDLLMSIH
jgi:hypothetical protein